MKKFTYYLSTLFSRNAKYLFNKSIYIHSSELKRNRIKLDNHSNKVSFLNATAKKCNIRVEGKNNEVIIRSTLCSCNIYIVGENNKLIIDSECSFNDSRFIINGSNNNITILHETTANNLMAVCMGKSNHIHIGRGCMFADNVELWSSDTHPIRDENGSLLNPSKPITIKDHVWIGKHTKILKGVTIGENAIIGMNALVCKNIQGHTLNVGSPTRCIKQGVYWERNFITE